MLDQDRRLGLIKAAIARLERERDELVNDRMERERLEAEQPQPSLQQPPQPSTSSEGSEGEAVCALASSSGSMEATASAVGPDKSQRAFGPPTAVEPHAQFKELKEAAIISSKESK